MNRKDKILKHIDKDGHGIEIGPSHNPVAPKRGGYNVHVIDHMSREELVEKYTGHGVDLEQIEPVDFVWENQSYADLLAKTNHYDWVIASHMIEHTPDLIGFLNDCTKVLNERGVISLAIPDKRYCFDHYRPITGLAQLIDHHHQQSTIHTPGTVAEYMLNVVSLSGNIAWSPQAMGNFAFVHSCDDAQQSMQRVIDQQAYLDVHAWCFVPHSFRLLMHDLFELGMISVREIDFYPTEGCEFFVTLGKQGTGVTASRIELLQAVDAEIKAGIESPSLPPKGTLAVPQSTPATSLKRLLRRVKHLVTS
ncbi:hypothetical protein [Nodosilinea sp. E11]|uniref:class I SAM-dependent methyltransferase n=1 Tax=Nodosilinea sp. E11 TaxID=3037479 RepID=UPI0029344FA9|nr:hypothetical protein [Nodosilinea sp. E11]WOD40407.1 hypothetical protein RRF56_06325 [Nodosilinea sp. E11]